MKTNGLAAASQSFSPFLWCVILAAMVFLISRSGSMPHWWYNVGLAVFVLVSGAWDRVTYRRNAHEPKPTAPSSETPDRVIDTSASTLESKPVIDWQQLYPDRWMLIEVTSEDERGVAEGKLLATAEDPAEFRVLDSDRYVVAIYGRR